MQVALRHRLVGSNNVNVRIERGNSWDSAGGGTCALCHRVSKQLHVTLCTVAASDFLTPSVPFSVCVFNLEHDFVKEEKKKAFDKVICIFNARQGTSFSI